MAKLPVISGKKIIKILSKFGFAILDQQGSHVILLKKENGDKIKVIVPMHKTLVPGTLISIMKQAKITREDLEKIRRR
ncbi:MAG: type II toxin-antitoxin system HicA family toxin [Candidatus Diapherotrites archaeon]